MTHPIDRYSTPRIPFLAAEWIRRHRFSPLSVQVTKALRQLEAADAALEAAHDAVEAANEALRAATSQVTTQIQQEETHAVQ